jgi:DNA helicase IV
MAYTFALPSIIDLSNDQKIAVKAGIDTEVLIISGCPGSGKTTVAMMRNMNRGKDGNYHYTVWANLLYGYLLNLSPQLGVDETFFSTFYTWFYTKFRVFVFGPNGPDIELIEKTLKETNLKYKEFQFDEAQDLDIRVRVALSYITEKYIICMDAAQDVNGLCDINRNEVDETKKLLLAMGKRVQDFKLNTNWRNTQPIFDFAKSIVPELNQQISVDGFSKPKGFLPEFRNCENHNMIIEEIVSIIRNEEGRNIGIFDESLSSLDSIGRKLQEMGMGYTKYDNREHQKRNKQEKLIFLKSMSNVVLSTFISCKGLEFNTVIIVDVSKLSDDLKKKKGYYVGCTRAQEKLILLNDSSNMKLPQWFQNISLNLYENLS